MRQLQGVPKALLRSEHDEQVHLFTWASLSLGKHPELALMFAIPNFSGRLGNVAPVAAKRQGARLKAEGRKRGVPDVFLPAARGDRHGLFIEMKRAGGVPSNINAEQREWHNALYREGYTVNVCFGFEEARDAILTYLNSKTT